MDTKTPVCVSQVILISGDLKRRIKNIQNQTGQSEAESLDYEVGVNQCWI